MKKSSKQPNFTPRHQQHAPNTPPSSVEAVFQQAKRGTLTLLDLFAVAERLGADQQLEQSIVLYRLWLEHTVSPLAFAAYFNLGVALTNANDHSGAEQAYRQAIGLKSDFIQAHFNLGTLLERRGLYDEALAHWRLILQYANLQSPDDKALYLQALNNLGRLLENTKQLQEAEQMLKQSLVNDPSQTNVITHWVHLRQKQCEWPVYSPFDGVSIPAMIEGTSALAMLGASDDPALQLATARRFVESKVITQVEPLSQRQGYDHQRLKIGYLSSDFCSHAVSILTAELFELHDRSKFEIYAFCWSHEDGSALRARIINAMDHYIRIADMSDEDAARCIRSHEIDILVDLHGLTSGTRPNIVSYRPAPVQITYLGFPGTTALPSIDYVIADHFVLPEELTPFFTEKPLYMPHSFQINDRQRTIGPRPSKASCGLPDDAFVFCSFNNNFKFTPEVFSVWMRILQRTPDSILWLLADNDWARENMCQTAEEHGIGRERLIFAGRVGPANYLARYQLADLFLDTFPFNAGTTASDALWAGLPLLTYAGRTFASRMAGSLLNAIGLPELIATSLEEYENKAVNLAQNRSHIEAMKQHLDEHRLTCHLFDSPQFVRDLEGLYESVARHQPQKIEQTPINSIHNVDVLDFMRRDLATVVEVGSSSGALALAYRQLNPACRYIGIEIVKEYAEASKQHCTEVIFGDVEALPEKEFRELAGADCWVFADALEHLYDPWKLLKRIRRHSVSQKPVEIIACIPNAQNWGIQSCLNTGHFIYQESGLLDRSHIRWFTRQTIIDLFHSSGFTVVEMRSRTHHKPNHAMVSAIRQMAVAAGSDPDMAEQDAIPFQYVVKAVSNDVQR